MLSYGQSSSKYLKTEIPQMLAIIHLQDQRYWYPYSINIHAETKHYTHVVGLKPVKSIRVGNCNEDMSLAVSAFTQHRHQLIKRTQTETNVLWTPFCFVCTCVSWVYTWAWAYSWSWVFFRAESSDLSHVGIYTGMGVILIWALLWVNTVCTSLVLKHIYSPHFYDHAYK